MLIALFVIINIPTKTYSLLSKILPWLMLGILIAVRLFGQEIKGSRSWIPLGSFNFQASEFVKTMVIIFMATYYGDKKKWSSEWSLVPPLTIPLICVVCIALEPDLGTAIIVLGIIAMIFVALPIRKWKIYKIVVPIGIIGLILIFIP